MTPLDDAYFLPPSAARSKTASIVATCFFKRRLNTLEIARRSRIEEPMVVRFVPAIENERRTERLKETA